MPTPGLNLQPQLNFDLSCDWLPCAANKAHAYPLNLSWIKQANSFVPFSRMTVELL